MKSFAEESHFQNRIFIKVLSLIFQKFHPQNHRIKSYELFSTTVISHYPFDMSHTPTCQLSMSHHIYHPPTPPFIELQHMLTTSHLTAHPSCLDQIKQLVRNFGPPHHRKLNVGGWEIGRAHV